MQAQHCADGYKLGKDAPEDKCLPDTTKCNKIVKRANELNYLLKKLYRNVLCGIRIHAEYWNLDTRIWKTEMQCIKGIKEKQPNMANYIYTR
jgi:hypothetical protein